MRLPQLLLLTAAAAIAAACASSDMTSSTTMPSNAELKREVADTERAFAKTMADRDHAAFVVFLADEAVFFSGPAGAPLRGKREIAERWARFYEKPQAPFSWEPDQVEVLDSGHLALSSGPVHNPQGKLIARFTSIWRREGPGTWRIVFDKGSEVCE
jgi:ketosteroid isomerase-like protein